MGTDPEENQGLEKPSDASQEKGVGTSAKDEEREPLYVVGMGGSAGGLEAFEEFFRNLPLDTGLAFVIVSHLDPTHKGFLPEILQRDTSMKVFQAEDGMRVEPDHIYIIPPNKDMTIMHGVLQLLDPAMPHGLRMPIDFFFRHLAEDQREKSIAIILSGMGSDGTLGLKAIKEKLGTVMAQDPQSAGYSSMPQSAINTGLVDYIAPAYELPDRLIKHAHQYYQIREMPPAKKEDASGALQKIFALIRDQTGNDFSLYKKSSINRRIERRMSVHQIADMSSYVRFLRESPDEIDLLFKDILIGVTSFFRDPEAFESLKSKALPEIVKGKKRGDTIRIWVVGCSTGEEAYSIAIILSEYLAEMKQKFDFKIQIYATDLDKGAIDVARQGLYPENIAIDVTPQRLDRFFTKEDDHYRIKENIRGMIVFAVQNVLSDPPFTKIDILSCRNLLIYLSPRLQERLFPLFSYSLNPGGILLLGSAESVGNFTDLFKPLDGAWKIFARRDTSISRNIGFPISPVPIEPRIKSERADRRYSEANIANVALKFIIDQIVPPVVIINDHGDILYTTRRTGKYLEPTVGKVNVNIYAMAREGLKAEIGIAIRKALTDRQKVVLKGLRVKTNGSDQPINLRVTPLSEPEPLRGLLAVEFEDIELPPQDQIPPGDKSRPTSDLEARNQGLEKELQNTKEHLQTVIEEMETSQEELQSTNEELQSTNEELQSTNEEVVTSKEELQSLNEELTTLNSELQSKNEDLTQANNDMVNILNSTRIPTIFVDNNLNIKRFTPPASEIINLISTDAGRPITDISSNLQYEGLADDIKQVNSSLVPRSVEVQAKNGNWYRLNINPYRTTENVIDGAVLTFVDISELKEISFELEERTDLAEGIIRTVREPLMILDGKLNVVSANPPFYRMFDVLPQETEGQPLYSLGNGQWDIPELRTLLETILPQDAKVEDFKVEHRFPRIGQRMMLLNAQRIEVKETQKQLILLAIDDVTNRTELNTEHDMGTKNHESNSRQGL